MNADKEILSQKLIRRKCLWSIKIPQEIPDDILIEKTLIYLDLEDMYKTLFSGGRNSLGPASGYPAKRRPGFYELEVAESTKTGG